MLPFKQVDVFSNCDYGGNPVAVVMDAEGLSDQQMQRFAAWTNLSESTFLLPPSRPEADYSLRIFTSSRELPFAGHPTLGSCHAWLEQGKKPKHEGYIVQECSQGLIRIEQKGNSLYFCAPPLVRYEPLGVKELDALVHALGISREDVIAHAWCCNGPNWRGLLLKSADAVLNANPDKNLLTDEDVGIIGPFTQSTQQGSHCGFEYNYEVRAFCALDSPFEDPATGSLNAALAQWLIANDFAPKEFSVRQGTVVGRSGHIKVYSESEDKIWVGGDCTTCIVGKAKFN